MITPALASRYRDRLGDLEGRLAEPGAASQSRKFQELIREHARVRRIVEKADAYFKALREQAEYKTMVEDTASDGDMRDLARGELAAIELALPALEREAMIAMLPPDPADDRNIIMEIRAGTGGDEAGLFAAELFRMYTRYAEGQGWKVAILDSSASDMGGYKEVLATIEGGAIYRVLKFESGVHRVQRVPVTEAQGRVHTSAASVVIIPEVEDTGDEIIINETDLRVDTFRASGAGGQHVNRTDSAVRLTHLPSGVVVSCQAERSQLRNREKCMTMLKSKLLDLKRQEAQSKMGNIRKTAIGSGDRSEKIRTYNFPQNRLTDHRINFSTYSLDRVMEGDLQGVFDALYEHDLEDRMRQELNAVR
ncbi:MAG: peptide chain release factor 1 [Kiritimatiellia bacterium]